MYTSPGSGLLNVIHVSHEAVYKVGGIGTVLEGLINSRPYRDAVGRTVLVCPLFYPENTCRLGPGSQVEYSSLDQNYGSAYAEAFREIEAAFNVRLVYGQRAIEDIPTARRALCEVLLVDLRGINRDPVNALKGELWQQFGLQSDRYEHIWDYEQYVQLAAPAAEALRALRIATDASPAVVLAHEYMGVPTALALMARYPRRYRTVFHAHEVATIRPIVEKHPGHDLTFYNALDLARKQGLYLEQVFGPQNDNYKHAVIQTTHHFDGILAVGHHVLPELQFLGRAFDDADITLAFNGVPAGRTSAAERRTSRERLRDYCERLLGWAPQHIFTHVTRFTPSKALWRDLDVLAALEPKLAALGGKAVMLVLSCEVPRRPNEDIRRMEREWDWPLAHREGHPDLTPNEAVYYQAVQAFNARSNNIHVIYINQFGFSRETCGERVPEDVEFMDLRRGSDCELGLSLYEPFGISPLEPLAYGGLCAVSSSCGCVGFVKQASGGRSVPNVIVADYIGARRPRMLRDAMQIGEAERRRAELEIAQEIAEQIMKRLPATPEAVDALIASGNELARRMGWDAVAERFIFPAIERARSGRRTLSLGAG